MEVVSEQLERYQQILQNTLSLGVPKTDIVLGFVPENIRHMTDFGIS